MQAPAGSHYRHDSEAGGSDQEHHRSDSDDRSCCFRSFSSLLTIEVAMFKQLQDVAGVRTPWFRLHAYPNALNLVLVRPRCLLNHGRCKRKFKVSDIGS